MQRMKADASVPFGARDIAPLTGTPQYASSGNPGVSAATVDTAYHDNMMMDELMSFIEAAGAGGDDTQWSQVWQMLFRAYTFTDLGTLNALVAAPAAMTWPFVAGNLGLGTCVRIRVANTNTGPATLNFAGTGALPIVKPGGSALIGAELVAGRVVEAVNDGAGNWQLIGAIGLTSAVLAFTVSGTYLAKASRVWARGWGAGGGGGGANGAGSSGVGGAGAGYFEGIYSVVPGGSYPVTIGTGGSVGAGGGSPGAGTDGGTTSFSSFASATGGQGGQPGNGVIGTSLSVGGIGIGGNLINLSGLGGGFGYTLGGGAVEEGVGGGIAPFYGPPTGVGISAQNGSAAFYPGVGGGAGILGGSGAAGGNGLLMLVELP